MSFTGLKWQPLQLPLAAGLDTKSDVRAMQPPGLLVAKDVVFDEVGGLQLRKPLVSIGNSIHPSGTLANVRRVYEYGDEMVCFTKDAVYTWNANLSKWVSRGTHLAVKTDEEPVFVTTGDQIDCDRAESSNTIVYCWTDTNVAGGTVVYVAARDKSTGSVLMAPSAINSATRPRLQVLTGADVVLLFFKDGGGDLRVMPIDPDAPAVTSDIQVLAAANFNDYYDVCLNSADETTCLLACRRDTTTSYSVFKIDEAGAIVASATPARACTQAIAIAGAPNGTHLTVVRVDSANIESDYLLSSDLSDVTVNQAIGTTSNTFQIAAAYRSVTTGGAYRCYIFYPDDTDSAANGSTDIRFNYVDTAGSIGTDAVFISGHALSSRAFDHDGSVYVHIAFGGISMTGVAGLRGQLQNTYFLYRDDQTLVAKECAGIGGGNIATSSLGWLPGVQLTTTNTYSWCGMERRVIPLGLAASGYADRGPRDITITFDSNEARRVAKVGETLYITGGQLLQFDGATLAEVGFHTYPWSFVVTAAGSSGSIGAGTYTYKATWRGDNAKGERDRSTTATTLQVTCVANDEVTIQSIWPLRTSRRTGLAVEAWRTEANPDLTADFFLVTGQDPATITGDNRYAPMPAYTSGGAVADIVDVLSDASLTIRERNNENLGVLESLTPPPCSIITATEDRLFLAGVPGEPDNVWYSKLRTAGYVASFHDTLKVSVPKQGGDITALAVLNDTLVVFRESAVYQIPGEGFDNTGGGSNYGPARAMSLDVGAVSAEAVCLTPGGLIFKSRKGWYLLSHGGGLQYIGAKVADFDSDTVHAVHVIETNHHVRIVTSARVLCWDYSVNEWSEWTISDAVHAVIWNGTWHDVSTTAIRAEQAAYTSNADAIDITTAWIKPADLQGAVAVRFLSILGEYRSAHRLKVQIYYDYLDTVVDDKTWTVSPTTAGGPLQVRVGLSRPKCQAFKVRITPIATGTTDPPAGEALKLTGLALEVGFRGTLHRRFPSAQRT